MSLVSVRNGLVTTIQNKGHWSASEISTCDFGLATLSASCVILQPGPGTTIQPVAFGTMGNSANKVREKVRTWDIAGIVMIKDPGNALTLLGNLWTAVDDIYDSVNSDDTLNGSACAAHITAISRPSIDAFLTDGTMDYGFISFNVRAEEWD